jgi:hypothetical protein
MLLTMVKAEQLNKNWEKLLSHIDIHYSQDLYAELTTRESISMPVPDYPPGVEEQHKLSEEKRLLLIPCLTRISLIYGYKPKCEPLNRFP